MINEFLWCLREMIYFILTMQPIEPCLVIVQIELIYKIMIINH